MLAARSYRLTVLLAIVIWIVALQFLNRLPNFSYSTSSGNWSSYSQFGLSSSFSLNKPVPKSNPHQFRIDIAQDDHHEQNTSPGQTLWSSISFESRTLSLDPTQAARVAFDGKAWVFECQSVPKETLTVTATTTETITSVITATPESSDVHLLPPDFIVEGIPSHFPHRQGSGATEVEYLRYLISGLALNDTIIIVPTNTAFARLAINLNCRMRTLGISNVLYWALDESASQILQEYQIPVYYNPTFFSSKEEESYHTDNYIKMMAERPKFWKMIMRTGFNMLFLDADNAIFKNPMDEIVGDADLEGQIDEFTLPAADDINELPYMCGGAFYLKSNKRTVKFLDRMEKALVEAGAVDDQEALNLILRRQKYARVINRFRKYKNNTEIPYGGYSKGDDDDRISVRFVPIDKYMNGHIWQNATERDGVDKSMSLVDPMTKKIVRKIDPAIVHLNGQYGKERLLKEFDWWYVRADLTCPLPERE